MSALEPPDTHHLNAASGWLELGLPEEARAEIARLTATARQSPEVLAVEWDLHAQGRQWTDALDVASRLLALDPSKPAGWINRSYALHELRRTREAMESLLPALPMFPTLGVVPYNLACYACHLDDLDGARRWLRQAMEVDGRDTIIARARLDTDLTALHGELEQL